MDWWSGEREIAMSFLRYARDIDLTQPAIVKKLREAGYTVEILGRPVDLAVRRIDWPPGIFLFGEAKTPNNKGLVVLRKDREDQHKFCLAHRVSYWLSPEQALNECDAMSIRLGEAA